MVEFFEQKLHYFGPNSLARPLCLADLDSDSMRVLKSGVFQITPERDTSGRMIVGSFQIIDRPYKRPESMVSLKLPFFVRVD